MDLKNMPDVFWSDDDNNIIKKNKQSISSKNQCSMGDACSIDGDSCKCLEEDNCLSNDCECKYCLTMDNCCNKNDCCFPYNSCYDNKNYNGATRCNMKSIA